MLLPGCADALQAWQSRVLPRVSRSLNLAGVCATAALPRSASSARLGRRARGKTSNAAWRPAAGGALSSDAARSMDVGATLVSLLLCTPDRRRRPVRRHAHVPPPGRARSAHSCSVLCTTYCSATSATRDALRRWNCNRMSRSVCTGTLMREVSRSTRRRVRLPPQRPRAL